MYIKSYVPGDFFKYFMRSQQSNLFLQTVLYLIMHLKIKVFQIVNLL